MGSIPNMLHEFVKPKQNVHRYIKVVRNLKDTCGKTLGELGSIAQAPAEGTSPTERMEWTTQNKSKMES